jgi:uncharacterized protein (DUF4415 family)
LRPDAALIGRFRETGPRGQSRLNAAVLTWMDGDSVTNLIGKNGPS